MTEGTASSLDAPSIDRVRFRLNGEYREVDVDPSTLLVSMLRETLGLTGTKVSCGIGVCGACSIHLDGQVASACLLLVGQVDGRDVTTIEGLGSESELDPVQQSFVDRGGLQCGICTPGQVMAAHALLNEVPAPSDAEVKDWMTGNLCRCTGYYKIIESVMTAADQLASRRSPDGRPA